MTWAAVRLFENFSGPREHSKRGDGPLSSDGDGKPEGSGFGLKDPNAAGAPFSPEGWL